MNKQRSTLLCALLLGGSAATAQRASPDAALPEALRPYLRYTAAARQGSVLAATPTTAKTTATRERLIGYSVFDDLGDLSDSARFVYSGTRGSAHGVNDLSSYLFAYDPYNEHLPKTGGVSLLGPSGPLNILCDTGVLVDGDYLPYQTMAMQYGAANRLQRYRAYYFSGGMPDGVDEYRYTYNSAGQTTRLENDYAAAGTPLPYSVIYSRYGTTGAILVDSLVSPTGAEPTSKIEYTYNAAGLLTNFTIFSEASGTFQPGLSTDYTHDAAGRFQTSVISVDFGGTGTLMAILKDTIGYTGTYPFPSFVQFSQFDGTSFSPAAGFTYRVNSAGLRDSLTITNYSTGSPVVSETIRYRYTAAGNLQSSESYDSTGAAAGTSTFYYQTYDDAVGVEERAAARMAFTTYPNPVASTLNLSWDPAAAGARVQICLADAAGRTLLLQTASGTAGKAALDVSRYAPGLYTVTLSAADGAPLQSLKVVKE